MNELVINAFYGLLGGLIRGIVGYYKAYRSKSKKTFKPTYFLITILGSALIGAFVAFTLVNDYRISILVGYAGIDILENIVKIYNKKT